MRIKLMIVLLCATLLAACTPKAPPPAQSQASSQIETPEVSAQPQVEQDQTVTNTITVEDDRIRMQVQTDSKEYTTNEVIPVEVTLTNIGETPVFYVKGSGSNQVPDALQVKLDALAAMFYPEIMTFDYQVERLEAGASVTFSCPFAPFIPTDDRKAFGTDIDLSYFEDGAFERAQPGMLEGSASFLYTAAEKADEQEVPSSLSESPEELQTDFSILLTK